MKILVTGAYGFVGTNLCRFLTEKGHVCTALDLPAARRDGVPYAAFRSWDDLDAGRVDPAAFDAIVHLAGKAHDLKKVASEQSYFDINVGRTQRLFTALRAARTADTGRRAVFVYFSSSKADAHGNAYGRSKLAAEEWLAAALREEPADAGLRTIALRPAMIHGPGNKGNLNLLWGIARRGLPWPLAAFENRRSFTSIGNICAVVEALCATGGGGDGRLETYSVADDETVSTNRLIELIAEAAGKKARLWRISKGAMRFAARVGDALHLPLNSERLGKLTEDSVVDNAPLKKALDWKKMPIRAEDGFRATLRAFADSANMI